MTTKKKEFQHAQDILERIAFDETFAGNIISLGIHGYTETVGHEGVLLRSIRNLTSLKFLRISQSDLEPSVVEGIVQAHPYLQTLSFENAIIPTGLAAISSLRRLSLSCIPNSPQNYKAVQLILQRNAGTLHHFELGTVEGGEAWLEPTTLSQIRSLAYSDGRLSSIALNMILTQAHNIEQLTLHAKPVHMFAPASLFKVNAQAFPNLRALSLRINDSFALDLGLFNAFVEFIRDRPNLEMLAIQDFSGANRIMAAGLGECLATLPGLKALKLSAKHLKGNALSDILPHIPKRLEALAIGMSFRPDEPSLLKQLELFIPSLRCLRGLFIHPNTVQKGPRSTKASDQVTHLADRLPDIEFIGTEGIVFCVKRPFGRLQLEPFETNKVDSVIDWVLEWRSMDLDFVVQ